MSSPGEVESLYHRLIACWNQRDADGFAACFASDGTSIGFDGTTMRGRQAISGHLRAIFGDHETASYVTLVRDDHQLAPGAAVLQADVGMIPPGDNDLNPAANAIQTMVAVEREERWQVALLQNTPAAFHGRPDDAEALTAELRKATR